MCACALYVYKAVKHAICCWNGEESVSLHGILHAMSAYDRSAASITWSVLPASVRGWHPIL